MRDESSHCDVTLASEDGHVVEAHRVILSAGSDFFRGVFRCAKPYNLYLYLKGIKRQELENIVDFLYKGETYLAQAELNRFLAAARELKIKGLDDDPGDELPTDAVVDDSAKDLQETEQQTIVKEEEEINPSETMSPRVSEKTTAKITLQEEIASLDEIIATPNRNVPAEETKKVKPTPAVVREKVSSNTETAEETVTVAGGGTTTEFEIIREDDTEKMFFLNYQLDQMMEKVDGLWTCKVCGKTGGSHFVNNRSQVRQHCEVHLSTKVQCSLCKTIIKGGPCNMRKHRRQNKNHL